MGDSSIPLTQIIKQIKMKKHIIIALMAFIAVGCNKDQKAVKQLDGEWNATSFIYTDVNGQSEQLITNDYSFKMTFNGCKLKDEEFCEVIMEDVLLGVPDIIIMDFRVNGDGEYLEVVNTQNPSEAYQFEIRELDKDDLELNLDYGTGETNLIKLEKM
jgi:hypothetical protein